MSIASTLSKIALTAALGAASAAYATSENNQVDAAATANSTGQASGNSITYFKASNVYVNVNNDEPTTRVLSQGPVLFKKGFFTDTQVSSRIIQVQEAEYHLVNATLSEETPPASISVKDQGAFTQKFRTAIYQEVQSCEGNAFYVKCESSRTPLELTLK